MLRRARYSYGKSPIRLPICLSVCNVGGFWSHSLEFFENNFMVIWFVLSADSNIMDLAYFKGNTLKFWQDCGSGIEKVASGIQKL